MGSENWTTVLCHFSHGHLFFIVICNYSRKPNYNDVINIYWYLGGEICRKSFVRAHRFYVNKKARNGRKIFLKL